MKILIALMLLGSVAYAHSRESERLGLSALLCAQKEWRAQISVRVSEERAGAKKSGAVDLRELHSDGQLLVDVDAAMRLTRALLKAHRLSPIGCGDYGVDVAKDCFHTIKIAVDGETPWYGTSETAGVERCDVDIYRDAVRAAADLVNMSEYQGNAETTKTLRAWGAIQ